MSKTIKLAREVRIGFSTARTVLSAEREIIGAFVDIRWYGPEHPSATEWVETIEGMAAAITEVQPERTFPRIINDLNDRIERSWKYQRGQSEKHWNHLRATQPHLDALLREAEATVPAHDDI